MVASLRSGRSVVGSVQEDHLSGIQEADMKHLQTYVAVKQQFIKQWMDMNKHIQTLEP